MQGLRGHRHVDRVGAAGGFALDMGETVTNPARHASALRQPPRQSRCRDAPTTHQQAGTPLGTVVGIVAGGAALP